MFENSVLFDICKDQSIVWPRAGLKPTGPIAPSWAPCPILQTMVQVDWEPGPTKIVPNLAPHFLMRALGWPMTKRKNHIHIYTLFLQFSFQPMLYNWCNKGRGMCYPVCGMVHIKEALLLIGKSSPCGGSGIPLSLSEWSFTICPTPYNRKIKCVECVVK